MTRDDDYYFAGNYPGPVNAILSDEPVANFERLVASYDSTRRIHFPLTSDEAAGTTRFRLRSRLMWGGDWNGTEVTGFGTHHIQILVNNTLLWSQTVTGETMVNIAFTGTPAAAITGANVLTISRPGGSAYAWLFMDFLRPYFRDEDFTFARIRAAIPSRAFPSMLPAWDWMCPASS